MSVTPTPNFFIVGAPKCATTALNRSLSHHPEVFIPKKKEAHYFGADLRFNHPRISYDGYVALFRDAVGYACVGEASVWYLYSKTAAQEIHDFLPEARIIIMLRNPVDLVYSQHGHYLWNGDEDIHDFAQALAAERDRESGRRIPPGTRFPDGLLYRRVGSLAPQVRRYVDAFPGDQIHIMLLDDLKREPGQSYQQVLRFLGVDDSPEHRLLKVNESRNVRSARVQRALNHPNRALATLREGVRVAVPRRVRDRMVHSVATLNIRTAPRSPMSPELRGELTEFFSDDVLELENVIGRDLSAWRTPER